MDRVRSRRDQGRDIYYRRGSYLGPAQKLAAHAENAFESSKLDVLSILTNSLSEHEDTFLASIREQVEHITIMSRTQV